MPHNVRAALVELFGDSFATDDLASDVTVGTAAILLLKANARRVSVQITNFGGAPITIGLDFSVTASKGIQVAPGETLEMDWQEDYESVCSQYVAISAVAGNAIHVLESILVGTTPPSADL